MWTEVNLHMATGSPLLALLNSGLTLEERPEIHQELGRRRAGVGGPTTIRPTLQSKSFSFYSAAVT